MAVLFDVSPKDVEPGHDVTLNATLINTGTNTTFTGYQPTVRFYDVSSSGAQSTHSETDNGDGKIYYTLTYPNDGHAHAYKAEVVSNLLNDTLLPQSIVSNPVQLTASKTTRFILNASREYSSTTHTIYGWLKWNETGVGNVTVKLKVNETEYLVTTDGTGYFSKTLDLKPVDDAPTPYEVLASFEDNFTQAINCTAYATTPDGQDYPACTTVQYGYKPATKTLNLEVTYESTKVTDPDSPEAMQQKAQDKGWTKPPEPWFGLCYPWFRLHFFGLHDGVTMIDAGLALLPGGSDLFLNPLLEAQMGSQISDLPGLLITGMIIGEIALWAAGNIGPWAFAVVAGLYIGYRIASFYSNYNSVGKLWENLAVNIISIMISTERMLEKFALTTFHGLASQAIKLKNWAFAFIYGCVMTALSIFLAMSAWNRLHELGAV